MNTTFKGLTVDLVFGKLHEDVVGGGGGKIKRI